MILLFFWLWVDMKQGMLHNRDIPQVLVWIFGQWLSKSRWPFSFVCGMVTAP